MECPLGSIFEAFNLADSFAKHLEGIVWVDLHNRQNRMLHQQRFSKLIKVVSTATMPIDRL